MRLKSAKGASEVISTQLEITDISISGIGFWMGPDQDLEINEQIAIEFQPPKGEPMATMAIVVRVQKMEGRKRVGAQFTFQNQAQLKNLKKSLSTVFSDKKPPLHFAEPLPPQDIIDVMPIDPIDEERTARDSADVSGFAFEKWVSKLSPTTLKVTTAISLFIWASLQSVAWIHWSF